MIILSQPNKKDVILKKHNHYFKTMIKAVVDVEKEEIALDGELHTDLEHALLARGSEQENVWGINLFLEKHKKDWIEYTALINIRPSMNNRSMEVENHDLRRKIADIVFKLIIG